ncbi:MAG: hypothetical protein JWN22_323 [Nocardioides sp.]|jgi:hypothetical protein|nr:hypothetical protein [Nocardioides sp.]
MSAPARLPLGRPLALLLVAGVLAAFCFAPVSGASGQSSSVSLVSTPSSAAAPHSRQARALVALAHARSLLLAHPAPARVRTSTPTHGRDATLVLRRVWRLRDALPPAARSQADRLLARPTDGPSDPDGTGYQPGATPRVLCDVICVHWVDTSSDKVAQTDDDEDGVPDYVQAVVETMTHVHEAYVDAGYRAPEGDGSLGGDDRTDVYLADIGPQGYYGYCTSDQDVPSNGPYDAWAYCVLDNDYAPDEFPTNTPVENLEVTAAHEYFHAVQFAYDAFEDGWFMEATATWAEDELYDAVDDNLQYLPSGPQANPRTPLDAFEGLHQYGDWIFFRYLTERFPRSEGGLPVLVRDMWEWADASAGAPDRYSIQAVRGALADVGAPLATTFARFADANRTPGASYEEGAANHYPVTKLWGSVTLSPAHPTSTWGAPRLDHLTSATSRFTPSGSLRTLKVQVDLANRARGSAALVTVYLTAGAASSSTVPLNAAGNGSASFPFAPGKVRFVEVTVVNASDRFSCWQGSPYSCQGGPLDDNLVEKLRGVASR